ncbi:MAG: tetratricopeptide repeat protein [Gammaproteobacteria bacterium]|jgi:predicted negative regulator of RcsB-dependent stress response|nr:tetratricopeptide repeat protein [Gammaproteobacteria bacterium]
MNEYETEEQQIEALKKWWKENGTSLIIGLLVGVTALFGWRYYMEHKNTHAMQASDLYMQVMQNVARNNVDDKTIDIHNQLINKFSDTPYAALSALALAKSEYEKGNVDAAAAQLELAAKYADDETIVQIANLRLVSIYIEQGQYEAAEKLLNASHDNAYDARYEELRGDLYLAKGDKAQARTAYDKAIGLQGVAASKWLKLKRQNLGESMNSSGAADAGGSLNAAA